MYLWTIKLIICFLLISDEYSTANPIEDEQRQPTFVDNVRNWFKNLKNRIVEFWNRSINWFSSPKNDDTSWDDESSNLNNSMATSKSPSSDDKSLEYQVEKLTTFEISQTVATTEFITYPSSDKSIEKNTVTPVKNSQSAEVLVP